MSDRILVAYATKHGHTRRIAQRVADTLGDCGREVDLRELRHRRNEPVPLDYAAVVAGGSIHAGRHQRQLVGWARAHAVTLGLRPTAFFSVSLTAADDTDEARADTRRLIDEFSEQTGWTPDVAEAFAGALQYLEYDLPARVLMRLIARSHHQPTDVSRDVDYTDWDAVDRFAHRFVERLAERPQSVSTSP